MTLSIKARRFGVRALALLLLLIASTELRAQPGRNVHNTSYRVGFLGSHAAEVLAWEQCPEESRDDCAIATATNDGKLFLNVRADVATHERIARALAEKDRPLTQSFQITLLAAGDKPGAPGPDLAPGVRKAIDELRGLVPYECFEVLDTLWLRGTAGDLMRGRLVGRNEIGHQLTLHFRALGGPGSQDLFVDGFSLTEEPGNNLQMPGGGTRGSRRVLDTSFGLKSGQTLVIGTSKLDGGEESMVVLLTAVPAQ
ncbi:MAG TPA: hypothetical protein VJ725_06745 [Thermoanaerobaculia bacterium]|nr:hypothetical protein [Thermoanaerobaculia bacterium]